MSVLSAQIRLVDLARDRLPGALDGMILRELFMTVREFFMRSDAWTHIISFCACPRQHKYKISPAAEEGDAFVNRLLWVEGLRPCSDKTGGGLACAATMPQPGAPFATIEIRNPPSAPEKWHAHVALTVVDPTDHDGFPRVPDWLFDKHMGALLDGLLARMMTQPAKPYSNAAMAQYHGRRFENGVNLARTETRHGTLASGQRWSFPRSFQVRSQRAWGW
ncbi:hypothetical protein [Methylocella sp.]|uniref:hypothetical protein n=1 Tax=Methylocella sp. TaxID=1978226 RepID=UPI0035B41E4F